MVDIPNLSVGSEYNRLHTFQPVNVQGYLVELHVTPSVLLMGKLLNQKKRPLKYKRGYLVSTLSPEKNGDLLLPDQVFFRCQTLFLGNIKLHLVKNGINL